MPVSRLISPASISKQLSKAFAGRRFDHALLEELPASADPCGEKGEFHSCVVAGPMLSRRIPVAVAEVVEREGFCVRGFGDDVDVIVSPPSAARAGTQGPSKQA